MMVAPPDPDTNICSHTAATARSGASPSVGCMPIVGEYEPSPWDWVSTQVEQYERSGGREANTLLDTGLPIIIVTTRGNKTGKIRKTALMRVEHGGDYLLVASVG